MKKKRKRNQAAGGPLRAQGEKEEKKGGIHSNDVRKKEEAQKGRGGLRQAGFRPVGKPGKEKRKRKGAASAFECREGRRGGVLGKKKGYACRGAAAARKKERKTET